jgi:hypothetical protein
MSATARKKKKGGGVLGRRAAKLGQLGPTARAWGKRKRPLAWVGPRAEGDVGPAGRKEREREEKRISFFF